MYAASEGHRPVMEILLTTGADVNSVDREVGNPLSNNLQNTLATNSFLLYL
jgi:ankyrin repeat protein